MVTDVTVGVSKGYGLQERKTEGRVLRSNDRVYHCILQSSTLLRVMILVDYRSYISKMYYCNDVTPATRSQFEIRTDA